MSAGTVASCEGCGEIRELARYLCLIGCDHQEDATWQECEYCRECASLAQANWNGETWAVVRSVCIVCNVGTMRLVDDLDEGSGWAEVPECDECGSRSRGPA